MTRLQPVQSYHPSARLRLIVRLEDYGAPDTPVAATKPTTLKKGVTATKGKNDQKLTLQNVDGAYVLIGPGDDPSSIGSPQQQQQSTDRRTHVIDGIIPRTANRLQNGIRTADTLTAEIDFEDFPIDPRVVRSCAVQYFLGCVTAEEYQRGTMGQLRTPGPSSNVQLPYSVVPDGYIGPDGKPRTNLRFEGWVDDWEDDFSGDGSPTLKLTCTDNTRLLLDEDAPPALTIGADQPLDVAIATYLANFPQFRGLSVEYRPHIDRSKIPVLKKVLKASAFQPKLGPTPAGGGTSKLKVWDYITDVVGAVGHVVWFRGTRLTIQLPRTLYNSQLPARPDDPFTGRVLPDGTQLPRRTYLFGENVAQMKYKRKFGNFQPVNIEVRSYDISQKKTIVVRYPQKGDRVKQIRPGDTSNEKWSVQRVRGVADPVTLRIIAQSIYEQLGRRELGVTLVTKNLGSLGGGNLDPDMLDVQTGDAVDVAIGTQVKIQNSMVDVSEQMRTRAAQFLRDLGFSANFADDYQRAINSIGLPRTYRIRTMADQWDAETEGVTLQAELMNYIEVRADKQLPAGEEVTAADVKSGEPANVVVSDSDLGVGL